MFRPLLPPLSSSASLSAMDLPSTFYRYYHRTHQTSLWVHTLRLLTSESTSLCHRFASTVSKVLSNTHKAPRICHRNIWLLHFSHFLTNPIHLTARSSSPSTHSSLPSDSPPCSPRRICIFCTTDRPLEIVRSAHIHSIGGFHLSL
jgi:hypothetical protein